MSGNEQAEFGKIKYFKTRADVNKSRRSQPVELVYVNAFDTNSYCWAYISLFAS